MAKRTSKIPDPTLREIVTTEIAMVNKNRWLSQNEKRLKVTELNKLLVKDDQ